MVDGEDTQIIPIEQALNIAAERNQDLVAISPNVNPPVCKIMDYSKFIYEQSKKEKENRKKQKTVELKEIRLSPSIEEHDIDIKANNAKKFLQSDNKVKVSIRFRGRQNNYTSAGTKIFEVFLSKIGDLGIIEKPAKLEGNNMILILAPKNK